MSGIVGIINLDGAPVDQKLLRQMTEFMSYRGPDTRNTWTHKNVGIGHTMLRTTRESLHECQPCSLDGQVWITADARVDGRADLIQSLGPEGRGDLEATADAELILRAYHVWGEDCVNRLIGDFAFAIWDGRQRRLFCARDHFGVKPFYYSHAGNCLVFSNTLNCLRMHPAVSDELNEQAIGDFLLFGFNQDAATTTFADIRRLPGAHCLKWWSEGALRLERYWTLPVEDRIRYKRSGEYVDHFRELMRTAVDDRLRTDRVGVFMSGGLDSPTVAATAKELLAKRSGRFDLRAHTVVYDRLIPDEERYYSGLVAEALNIPIHYLAADDYTLYERWNQPELYKPEPVDYPLAAVEVDQFHQAADYGRVVLDGEGSDSSLHPSLSYVIDLLKGLRFGRLAADVGRYILSHRRTPPVGVRIRLKRWLGKPPWQPPYPVWLNESFAARLDLPTRWEQLNNKSVPPHPLHPEAYERLTSPVCSYFFENYDPGVTLFPVEVRYPFFDVRLVNYLLAIPPIPWCVNKELLRVAMRGTLPELVRRRPKTPLDPDPTHVLLRQPDAQWVDRFEPVPELAKYVDRNTVPQVAGEQDYEMAWLNSRPLTLNLWLYQLKLDKVKYCAGGRKYYENA